MACKQPIRLRDNLAQPCPFFSMKNHGSVAFTLLELLIVVAIMSIMLGVSYPSMRSIYESTKRNAVALEFIGLCRYARTQAIVKQHDVNIFLNTEKHEYWFDPRTDLDPQDKGKPGKLFGTSKSSKKVVSQMEEKKQLPKNSLIKEINTYERQVVEKNLVALDFYPDGSASPATVVFESGNGKAVHTITVEVLRPSGAAQILKPQKDDTQEQNRGGNEKK